MAGTTTTVIAESLAPTEPTDDPALDTLVEDASPVVDDDVVCDASWSTLASDGDEVTFARDGDIFSFEPETGELHCLARLDRSPRRLDWNPGGDLLLVDADVVVSATGQNPSGFSPGTAGISWSRPTGTTLIATSADGSALRKARVADQSGVSDLRPLDTIWAADYHPSGQAIVSAGIDQNGTAGLFISDNNGNNAEAIVALEDPATTITEVSFAHNGDWVTFVHDRTGGSPGGATAHIHRVHFPDFRVEEVPSPTDVVPTALIASEQSDGTIAWQQGYSTSNVQTFAWAGGEPLSLRFTEMISDPVGFFGTGTAAIVVTPVGSDGSGQLWIWPPDGDPILLARDVTAATTRTTPHPAWSEPPTGIDEPVVVP